MIIYTVLVHHHHHTYTMIHQDFDVDDVGALCAAHGLVQLGEAEILAVGLYSDMYVHILYDSI